MNALPPIPEQSPHERLCDRADLTAQALFNVSPPGLLLVAPSLKRELLRIRVYRASPVRALALLDIWEAAARTPEQFAALVNVIAALRAIAAASGQEVGHV